MIIMRRPMHPHSLTTWPKPAESVVVSEKGCQRRLKTTKSYPHLLTDERNSPKSQIVSEKGYLRREKTAKSFTLSLTIGLQSARIASREQKRVSIEVENDENMHPFAHRRAKSNEIATREQEAAQTGQPETATLSGKSNPNGVATVTKCGRSSRKPRAPTPQTTAHTRNRCRAVRAGRAQSHARSQAAHLR